MTTINGVPYPIDVKDWESLNDWMNSIDRRQIRTNGAPFPGANDGHRELAYSAYFLGGDTASRDKAMAHVCSSIAHAMFDHIVNVPNGTIVWRIDAQCQITDTQIPSDLSKKMRRAEILDRMGPPVSRPQGPISIAELKKAIGHEDWGHDFSEDAIFPLAAPKGEWRIYKGYCRYSVVLDVVEQRVMPPKGY